MMGCKTRVIKVDPDTDYYEVCAECLIRRESRHSLCPLQPLPEKHGRLIEADSLKETLDYYIREAGWGERANQVLGWVKDEFIDSERTVVEAEG